MHRYRIAEHVLFPPAAISRTKLKKCLTGKTVLITGASSGIGESLAFFLADYDVHLILVARRYERLSAITSAIKQKKARVTIYAADLRSSEELEEFLIFLHQLPEGLDYFISNAGKSIRRPLTKSLERYHDFTRTMAINYFAPVRILLSITPILAMNRGKVINISTINALLPPVPYWAAYQASKSAFDVWFRSVSAELNALGIATASVYLPLVKTPMIEPTTAYQKAPAMSPEHVAKIICKLMYSPKKRFKPWWLFLIQAAAYLLWGVFERFAPGFINKKSEQNND